MREIVLHVADTDGCYVAGVAEELGGGLELLLELLEPQSNGAPSLRLLPQMMDRIRLEPPSTTEPVNYLTALELLALVR